MCPMFSSINVQTEATLVFRINVVVGINVSVGIFGKINKHADGGFEYFDDLSSL